MAFDKMVMEIRSLRKINKNFLAFTLLLITFTCISLFSGSFTKGYNINEDQDVIYAGQNFEHYGFYRAVVRIIKEDINNRHRLRPFSTFHLVLASGIFGTNFNFYSFYLCVLAVLSGFFIYMFGRNLGFSLIQALLFSLLTLVFPAYIVWAQITYTENIGMFMLSLSLFLLTKSLCSEKHNIIYKIFFFLTLFVSALCKESFILIIPAVILLYLWIDSRKRSITFTKSLKKNLLLVIVATTYTLFLLLYIVKRIGTDTQGYGGVNSSLLSFKTIRDFLIFLFDANIFLIALLGFIIVVAYYMLPRNKPGFRKHMINLFYGLIISFAIIIPQYLIYYKAGFYEVRYYLPVLIGFSFFTVYMLKLISDNHLIPPC